MNLLKLTLLIERLKNLSPQKKHLEAGCCKNVSNSNSKEMPSNIRIKPVWRDAQIVTLCASIFERFNNYQRRLDQK